MFEKRFKLKENNTNVKTEVIAGITTFMTMAYILAVNPTILSASGMDKNAILMATALAAFIGTLAMALLANYPFALAPGLGLNAYFAYTVCGKMGYSWHVALLAVFVEGLIFILLSLTNVREAIFNAIPLQLKKGVSVGIGFFVAFIGLQNGHLVVNDDSTLVTVVNFHENFFNRRDQRPALCDRTFYHCDSVCKESKGGYPDRNRGCLGSGHDLSGGRSLYRRRGKRVLFPVPGMVDL